MGVKRPKNERVVRITVRRGALNRGFFSPTLKKAVENPNEILLLSFGCVVPFDDDARATSLSSPKKPRRCFRRLSRRRPRCVSKGRRFEATLSLSLSQARARLRKRPTKRVSGAKKYAEKYVFFVSVSLSY